MILTSRHLLCFLAPQTILSKWSTYTYFALDINLSLYTSCRLRMRKLFSSSILTPHGRRLPSAPSGPVSLFATPAHLRSCFPSLRSLYLRGPDHFFGAPFSWGSTSLLKKLRLRSCFPPQRLLVRHLGFISLLVADDDLVSRKVFSSPLKPSVPSKRRNPRPRGFDIWSMIPGMTLR